MKQTKLMNVVEIDFYSRKSEYGWLSNFWRCPIFIDGSPYSYPTNEHYYQSEKAKDKKIKCWIRGAPTPYAAMLAGRSLRSHEIVDNWDNKKVEVMLTGLRAKFKNPELRQLLLNTGNAILHEDSPTDLFWGKKGKDMLGKLLMQVRDEIENEMSSCYDCLYAEYICPANTYAGHSFKCQAPNGIKKLYFNCNGMVTIDVALKRLKDKYEAKSGLFGRNNN